MKILIFLVLPILISGCSGSATKVVTKTPDIIVDDLDKELLITYESSSDKVTIKSFEEDKPFTLLGLRLNGENISVNKAKAFCGALGFIGDEVDFRVTNYNTTLEVEMEPIDTSDYYDLEVSTYYPIFHIDAFENPFSSFILQYVFEVDSHIHSGVGNRAKYVTEVSCFGTTGIHFDDEGKFSKVDFLKNILEKQDVVISDEDRASYDFSKPFLVQAAKGNWSANLSDSWGYTGSVRQLEDKGLKSFAIKAATEICIQSGMTGVALYTYRYINVDDLASEVYYFSESTGWNLGPKPDKYYVGDDLTLINSFGDEYEAEFKFEVPSLYFDNVFCY